jgi:hypothetical protein
LRKEVFMSNRTRISVALASFLGAGVAWVQVASAQGAGGTGGSMSDSPYKNGPPPITGGYTDTSQGGTKGSGEMPPNPMAPGGKDAGAQSGQQNKATGSTQSNDSSSTKTASGDAKH